MDAATIGLIVTAGLNVVSLVVGTLAHRRINQQQTPAPGVPTVPAPSASDPVTQARIGDGHIIRALLGVLGGLVPVAQPQPAGVPVPVALPAPVAGPSGQPDVTAIIKEVGAIIAALQQSQQAAPAASAAPKV